MHFCHRIKINLWSEERSSSVYRKVIVERSAYRRETCGEKDVAVYKEL